MRFLDLHNGTRLAIPETAEEELAMQPEAKLRAMFAGDTEGTVRFHDRLHELDRRFDTWKRDRSTPSPQVWTEEH